MTEPREAFTLLILVRRMLHLLCVWRVRRGHWEKGLCVEMVSVQGGEGWVERGGVGGVCGGLSGGRRLSGRISVAEPSEWQ